MKLLAVTALFIATVLGSLQAMAASYPEAVEHDWIIKDFKFHTGETLPELKIHYRTIGTPEGQPVLILHGTAGSGASMLTENFAGELFGEGQPLDAKKYFIILPDAIGTGKSTKPSDGLRAKFPQYNYDDMVLAQYRLVTEKLGIKKLKIIVGHSMGGMHAWMWASSYPDSTEAIVPMASQPTEMSSRNWMMRRMIIDAVRNDPAWKNGDYTEQPQHFRMVNVYYGIATNGGSLAYQAKAPTRGKADSLLADMLSKQTKLDANDFMYQWASSKDYNPSEKLSDIKAHVLAINSADDERNPPESGLMEQALKKIPSAEYYLIPASAQTSGHGTTANAKFWKASLSGFIKKNLKD
ncbi:alpha/beta fold hydrolase [Microvirga sp. W0021]|uniref:Alpha/beta fold hydrolase n=2 Tax=Hohaiivirga grylli TaxID=3133970 RepID=A0ABV0BL76_9HYPH